MKEKTSPTKLKSGETTPDWPINSNATKPLILVLHGPNLNLLGEREPSIYGHLTLEQVNQELEAFAQENGCELLIYQSNSEGTLIDYLHQYRKTVAGVVINPGAYTHYSYALRDAIAGISNDRLRVVEVHLSNIHQREEFRKKSVVKEVCLDQISGYGVQSYTKAIRLILENLSCVQ